ncbi:hypothetical protein DFH08DRAFT_1019203 [Mycena albidolilacea]|uniref:Leucine-rich repeat-containing protein 40 n=1 Tax=Mycena albidolilacea TaxID=1033008 RepID=A0AAD7EKL2_9AGAR|nr:hypothetical protein DFH08DRAFT_1019203 [Mycena albidolilacea]
MSRIPQPPRGTPRKAPASPTKLTAPGDTPRLRTKSSVARAPTSSKSTGAGTDKPKSAQEDVPLRLRTKSTVTRATTPSKPTKKLYADTDSFLDKPNSTQEEPPSKPLTIKEAIALKRAQAKKAQTSGAVSPLDDMSSLADSIPDVPPPEDDDILGRPPLRETIERAKSTGSINLSTRSLQCIPSALFDIHLGITPVPLKSVPEEPPLPPAAETRQKRPVPAWFETQDLELLKAWGNEIVEIQPEISLFGSLKSIDLHRNKIVSLPDQFTDLIALTTLDLSHNALTSLPAHLFSLPALANLNVSHNALTSLPFSAPFSSAKSQRPTGSAARGLFGGPEISRASTPLPKLAIFDASNNQLTAGAIHLNIPNSLITLDLSENPLESEGPEACGKLLTALAALQKLKVLRCEKADISDATLEGFVADSPRNAFPAMAVFDFGSTKVTEGGAKRAFEGLTQELTFEITNEDPPAGVARVIIGKKIVREAWELEAERRSKMRAGAGQAVLDDWETAPPASSSRAKAAPVQQQKSGAPVPAAKAKAPVVKEAWEIEAEQGLLTEGGKRRARAAAANSGVGLGAPPRQPSPTPKTPSLADPQYHTARTETLALPASTPPKLSGHARAFSLAATSLGKLTPDRSSDVALPTATLPLSLIATQPFAQTLKILLLTNRRMDRSFTLPSVASGEPLLPRLEELSLEGCNLGDAIAVSHASAEETTPVAASETKPLLPLLTELFPSLRNLNLAYNTLTSAALSAPVLTALILSSPADASDTPARKGLKQLHLRGNRITDLDGLREVGLLFKGNRSVAEWGLEELDVRDNEIAKLPAEVGLLPLDVLLVDGNVFRVPARRVWEREGTKGLLSWLRGRIE